MTTRPLHLATAGGLLALAFTVAAIGPTSAAGETCDGKAATIVISTAPPAGNTVDGTPGDDVIVVTYTGQIVVEAGDGNDTVCGMDASDLRGGVGGDDLLFGGVMLGGPGDDTLQGAATPGLLIGNEGNDTLLGGGGADELAGDDFGDPTDTVTPDDNDVVDAGPGDDLVQESWGDDTFVGGEGIDTFVIGNSPTDLPDSNCPQLTAKPVLDARAGTVTGLGNDTIDGFESYLGGPYDQTMLGTSGDEVFTSSECGTLHVRGRGGDDQITGKSAGGGVLRGGAGADHITIFFRYQVMAGADDDVVRLAAPGFDEGATYQSSLHGGDGVDGVEDASLDYDRIDLTVGLLQGPRLLTPLAGFENARAVTRSRFNGPTTVLGTGGPNVLIAPKEFPGEPQRTVLRGRRGNDQLLAGAHDTAHGGRGRHDVCRAQHRFGCEAR